MVTAQFPMTLGVEEYLGKYRVPGTFFEGWTVFLVMSR